MRRGNAAGMQQKNKGHSRNAAGSQQEFSKAATRTQRKGLGLQQGNKGNAGTQQALQEGGPLGKPKEFRGGGAPLRLGKRKELLLDATKPPYTHYVRVNKNSSCRLSPKGPPRRLAFVKKARNPP